MFPLKSRVVGKPMGSITNAVLAVLFKISKVKVVGVDTPSDMTIWAVMKNQFSFLNRSFVKYPRRNVGINQTPEIAIGVFDTFPNSTVALRHPSVSFPQPMSRGYENLLPKPFWKSFRETLTREINRISVGLHVFVVRVRVTGPTRIFIIPQSLTMST